MLYYSFGGVECDTKSVILYNVTQLVFTIFRWTEFANGGNFWKLLFLYLEFMKVFQ